MCGVCTITGVSQSHLPAGAPAQFAASGYNRDTKPAVPVLLLEHTVFQKLKSFFNSVIHVCCVYKKIIISRKYSNISDTFLHKYA